MPGEFDFIHWLLAQQKTSPLVRVPAGDDLAVVDWPANELLVVGVDQVLDGVHFDSAVHAPRQIGAKVMNRNLSDCAAMACLPAAAVCTAALPHGTGIEFAKELYLGMKEAGRRFGCEIVGGDTGSWPGKLVLTVTILGRSAGVTPVTRGGAKPGDHLYVTGPLGGSILGRHMDFTPRVLEARELVRQYTVTAMIDLSDGLSRDLGHICAQSRVAARLDADHIPIHDDAFALFRQDRREPLEHALHDGEDHELLFTSPDDVPAAAATRIGRITPGSGILIAGADGNYVPLEGKGWEHRL